MKRLIALIGIAAVLAGCGSMELKRPEQAELPPKTEILQKEETPTEEKQEQPVESLPVQTEESPKTEEIAESPEASESSEAEEEGKEPEASELTPVKNTLPEIASSFRDQTEYDPDISEDELSSEAQSWGFKRNKEHLPVTAYYKVDLPRYGTYYLGNTEEKVVYLTFDEGYENGFTPTILDILKEKQVKAAFFITGSYLKHNPELVKRMREEGHIVANHSQTHPDFTTQTDEQVIAEVGQVAEAFQELTGTEIDPFFRFPSGRYSERALYIVRKMGFRNIFWSMAYKDWEVNNQPGKEYAYQHVMENYHPGAIILLHAVSSSNTEALADIISGLDEAGYRFGSLYELE